MNSKERILIALDLNQPDKVPILEVIDEVVQVGLANLLGLQVPEFDEKFGKIELTCRLIEELELDVLEIGPSMGREFIDEIHIRDKYDCVFQHSEHGQAIIVDGPLKEPSDLKAYDMVSRLHDDDLAPIYYAVERFGDQRAIDVGITDPFKISWLLRGGMQNLLIDYATNPIFVHDVARIATDFNLAIVEKATRIGADLFFMDGDLAGERNAIMSPNHYREFIKPYQKELVDTVHAHGAKIIKHSDGNMWPLLEDHIDLGFDGFHPIQPDVMDIHEVKGKVGARICLVGNIDCRALLCSGTESEVEEVVRETIEIAAPGGGYIIASSNSIHPGVKPENYLAMVRAAHRYGIYPIQSRSG